MGGLNKRGVGNISKDQFISCKKHYHSMKEKVFSQGKNLETTVHSLNINKQEVPNKL